MDFYKGIGGTFIFILVVVAFVFAIYFSFFFSYTCDDQQCFDTQLERCSRTTFERSEVGLDWFFEIKGKEDDQCIVDVRIDRIKTGSLDQKVLQGHSMTCAIPFGVVLAPEADISLCHGRLKEELQGFIIKRLHRYLLNNLGQIDGELDLLGTGVEEE